MIWRFLQTRRQRPSASPEGPAPEAAPSVSWWRGRSVVEAGQLLEEARKALEGKKAAAQAEALAPYLEKAAIFTGAIDELELGERRANLIFKKDFGQFEIALIFAAFEPRFRQELEQLAPNQVVTIVGQVDKIQFSKLDLKQCELLDPSRRQDSAAGGATGPIPVAPHQRPRMLICSSTAGAPVAEKLRDELDPIADCALWHQGALGLSGDTLDGLVSGAQESDFAVLVLGAEDVGDVLFQLGLLVGALGRGHTFVVHRQDQKPGLPIELTGITIATFPPAPGGDLRTALGAVRQRLEEAMKAALVSR